MLEYFIIYEIATGAICYQAAVQVGVAALQEVGTDRALLIVPHDALTGNGVDLARVKAALIARIDVDAEALRLRFITTGVGQAMTYQYKADEARAWTLDHDAPTPFLSAEAHARGIVLGDLVAEVLAQVSIWTVVGAQIEATRLAAKRAIAAAETVEPALVAGTIDWTAIGADGAPA